MKFKNLLLIGLVFLIVSTMPACLPFSLLKSKSAARKSDAPRKRAKTAVGDQPISLDVSADERYVNVLGDEMPEMPDFEELSAESGKVRGYVKDMDGNPLEGAEIGLRTSYLAGMYSGVQGKSDADGYYEIKLPEGIAQFYNAGYQIKWGAGLAAVSLHPADGKIESFVAANGAVENFVMLPYGVTSPENLQENPQLAATYYGGSIYLSWYSVEADDNNAPPFAVRTGSELEIKLTPEGEMLDGSAGRAITIRKTAGIAGNLTINNIPLGRYRISITADGEPLKLKDTKKYDPKFGMTPAETVGEASILFIPESAKASSVSPQHGGWTWISIGLETP